jgi:hypothetical protein
MGLRVIPRREVSARSARRVKQEKWFFLLGRSIFITCCCKAGEMDAEVQGRVFQYAARS